MFSAANITDYGSFTIDSTLSSCTNSMALKAGAGCKLVVTETSGFGNGAKFDLTVNADGGFSRQLTIDSISSGL